MAVTIRDIAKKLNLSVSTVSYALNNGPRPVPERIRSQVLEVARELDYRPNRLARSMVTGRTHTIGIVPTSQAENLLISPFMLACLNGIVNECEKSQNDVLVYTRYDAENVEGMANSILDGRADGLVFIAPPSDSELVRLISRREVPYVVVNNDLGPGVPSYTVDNYDGVRQVMRHLYDLGHRKIGHMVGQRHLVDGQERLEAYLECMKDLGLPIRSDWILDGNFTLDGGADCMRAIGAMKDRPTAMFCANDEMARGALYLSRTVGITVPDDLSLVGFDDSVHAAMAVPSLTSVSFPANEIAAMAIAALVGRIERAEFAQSQRFPTALIVRASSTPPKEKL